MTERHEPTLEELAAWPGSAVLEFGSVTCGICARARPAITAALHDRPAVRHVRIEDGRGRPLGRHFRVKLWPTLVLLRDGHEVARVVRPTGRLAVDELLQQAG